MLSGDRHLGATYVAFLTPPLFLEIPSNSLNRPWCGANKQDTREVSRAVGYENLGTIDIDWRARRVSLSLRDHTGEPVRQIYLPPEALRPR